MLERVTQIRFAHVKGAPIIADQGAGQAAAKDGDPRNTATVFDKALHKKYHAKYYFCKESGKPIEDAKRSEHSQRAYNDFLEGLEQINNQEYLKDAFLGQGRGGSKGRVTNYLPLGNDSSGFIAGLESLERKVSSVHDMATWTRHIRTRSSAHTAQQFKKKLKRRAQLGILRDPTKVRSDMIPIRGETAALLTRPLQEDYSKVGALVYLVQIAIYCYTLWVQYSSVVGVCAGSYMCPFETKSSGLPVLAPPIVYRDDTHPAVKIEHGSPWDIALATSCLLNSSECDNPGYLIQWPYVEVHAGESAVEFPQELVEAGCTKEEKGDYGWQFDPFLPDGGDVRPEVWHCPDKDSIPFSSQHTSPSLGMTGRSVFHYKPALYRSYHNATLTCMDKTIAKFGHPQLSRRDWLSDELSVTDKRELRQEMVSCLSAESFQESQQCACSQERWSEWALGLYHPGSKPTATCVGGSQRGLLCHDKTENASSSSIAVNDDEAGSAVRQCVAGVCERHFSHEVPLNRNWLYGCWFTSAVSSAPQLHAEYHPCGLAQSRNRNQRARPEMHSKLQKSLELTISKRSLLALILVAKEGGHITAVTVVPVVALFLLSLLVFAFLVIVAPAKAALRACGREMDLTLNVIVVKAKAAAFAQLRILWTMCIHFSTLYNISRKVLALSRGLVNSCLRDFDSKLTTVANTVFSLILLINLSDDTVDTAIVSSLVLSLLQLLYAMNSEKIRLMAVAEPLKDLNENRLSKFEFALLVTKLMEDMLEDDVEYNWVQHFYSDEKLKPFKLSYPDTLGSSRNEYSGAVLDNEGFEPHRNLEEMFDVVLFKLMGEDEDSLVRQQLLKPIPTKLAAKFGHDGQGGEEGDQTVEWAETGRTLGDASDEPDRIVRVGFAAGKSDMEMLEVSRPRSLGGAGGAFFDKPLFFDTCSEAGADFV